MTGLTDNPKHLGILGRMVRQALKDLSIPVFTIDRKTQKIPRPGKERNAYGEMAYNPSRKLIMKLVTVTRNDTGRSLTRTILRGTPGDEIDAGIEEMKAELL